MVLLETYVRHDIRMYWVIESSKVFISLKRVSVMIFAKGRNISKNGLQHGGR